MKNINESSVFFFSLDASDDEAIEKPSDETATYKGPDSKPAVTKKRKQVCKFSSCVDHRDDIASEM